MERGVSARAAAGIVVGDVVLEDGVVGVRLHLVVRRGGEVAAWMRVDLLASPGWCCC